jgi:hypothetical protein
MNTRQSRIILLALLVVSIGAFSQATARGLTGDATQPVVEATRHTRSINSLGHGGLARQIFAGPSDFDGTPQPMPPPQKPTPWWEWLWPRFAGGGR